MVDIGFVRPRDRGVALRDPLPCPRSGREPDQAAQDRTGLRPNQLPLANRVRITPRTAAYWLVLKPCDAIPWPRPLATAEFTALRLRLIKIPARVMETTSRVRPACAAAHPEYDPHMR